MSQRYGLIRSRPNVHIAMRALERRGLVELVPNRQPQRWRLVAHFRQSPTGRYFSRLWGVELTQRSVNVGGVVPWKFDLVSPDGRYVGEVKWLSNSRVPAAKWDTIGACIWRLQKVPAEKVFMVFGRDAPVAERYLILHASGEAVF